MVDHYLAEYGTYHTDRRNLICHEIGIPLIVLSIFALLELVRFGPIDLAMVAGVAVDIVDFSRVRGRAVDQRRSAYRRAPAGGIAAEASSCVRDRDSPRRVCPQRLRRPWTDTGARPGRDLAGLLAEACRVGRSASDPLIKSLTLTVLFQLLSCKLARLEA